MSLLMPMSGLQFLIFLTGLQLILGSEKYNASVSVLATEEKISHPDGRKKGAVLVISMCIQSKNGVSKIIVHAIKHANFQLYRVHPDRVI